MIWLQTYNPTGLLWLSTLVAIAPAVVLLGALGWLRWSAPKAAAAGLFTALVVAIAVYGMPWKLAAAAAVLGAGFGLFPIGWIVFTAVFLYVLTVEAGEFEKVKASVVALSPDRRLQALLIAFSFGAFIEGAAGFGTPVAISAALLIGAGFPPLYAAGLTLIANTAPVAFGALGTPILTLAKTTGLDVGKLSAMAGRQLPLFSLLVPAWLVCTMSGWSGLCGVWPAVLVCGGTFAAVQFAVSNFLGPELADVAGGLTSLAVLAVMLRFWRPQKVWRFAGETGDEAAPIIAENGPAAIGNRYGYTRREIIRAWIPWIILSVCVFAWGEPHVQAFLNRHGEERWAMPHLDQQVQPDASVIGGDGKPKAAEFRFNWLSGTGTGIFVAAILSALWMHISPVRFCRLLMHTLYRLRWPLFTIACMLAIAFTTQYSGTDVTLGLAFTHTGVLYPFFAALLGWLGVALTGSDTSSNALFGNLQRITAERLSLNPILICAANSTGGVMGKMIDAQSIVVASAATGQEGEEGQILRFVFWHSVALATLVGILTLVQAYLLPGMVPK
ncbi:MAG TPA: L-lactate permease [Pirellulales bacterium]|jgi:lactate permease|nr:L-lactate permease [Pirellulales bacterium]